jgi:UDP-N-acetylglucosamine--N-acetylmuramyl-(pentapeptide) pyrophosphoryl-undecaprenol N-acetylglucosamine transferase
VKTTKTVIITGTHHTPAIELIYLLRSDTKYDWRIHYLGHQYPADTHISHTITTKLKVPFYQLECGKFDRKDLLKSIFGIPKIFSSFLKSISLIKTIKPDVVISFGGYVSVPVVIAAFFKGIPSITHEQTLTISLSTRINSLFANKVALSFDNRTYSNNRKVIITGNLIRQAIFNINSQKFRFLNQRIVAKPLLYITGGNQGSVTLNELVLKLIPKLNNFTIIHQTGKHEVDQKFDNYFPYEFIEIEDIGWILNNSDIIISRAGANICQEIDILNKKTVLIPLPFSQQNEQLLNALWLQKRHPLTTIIIQQAEITSTNLLQALDQLSSSGGKTKTVRKTDNSVFLNLIHDLI